MRSLLLALLFAAPALAAEVEHTGSYVGWGGAGEQVFRHKISVCRNHEYSDRNMLVIVDDLPRRGTRSGLFKFTVTYDGGSEASERLLTAIHKKPYEYVLIKVYQVPQSPRMARVVMPRAKGVKATFRFYHTLHRGPNGEKTDGLIPAMTRTLDVETLIQLPVVHPMRAPSIRKPRNGEDAGAAPTIITMSDATPTSNDSAAATPAPSPAAPPSPAPRSRGIDLAPQPLGLPEDAAAAASRRPTAGITGPNAAEMTGFVPVSAPSTEPDLSTFDPETNTFHGDPPAVAPDDPRIERTRAWARQVAIEIREKAREKARSRAANPDAGHSGGRGIEYAEDTPEMLEAQRRAESMGDAGIVERSTAVQ